MDFPFLPVAIKQLFSKPSCAMYPVKESIAAPNYRGRISYDADKCLGCGMCEKVCAGGAITREMEDVEEGKKITLTFDLGSCTFCGHCASFCSTKAITLTQDYHMVATKEEDLLVTGSHIKPVKKPAGDAGSAPASGKPKQNPETCVYCTLCAKKCPQEAITVDRAAKTWALDESKCIECGTCVSACPKKSITM